MTLDGSGYVFVNIAGERLIGYKHWFDLAIDEAEIKSFTWNVGA